MDDPQIIFSPWKISDEKKAELKLAGLELVEQPLKRIEYHVRRNAGREGGRAGGKGGMAAGSRGGGYHGRGRGEKKRGQVMKGNTDRVIDLEEN